MLKTYKRVIYAFVLFVFVLNGCKDGGEPTPQNKYLVSSTLVKEFATKDEVVKSLGSLGPQIALFVRSGVKQYRIVYKTKNTDGTEITASGGLAVPIGLTESLPLASLQHGTIINDADAPSYFGANSEGQIGSFLATTGYIVAMPDYIGYGESKNLPHSYEHREGLATASLDFIRAAKEFIKDNKINWNNSLYLSGYSEGGFATMSLFKKIEDEVPTEFNLKAVTAGSGAYNKTESFRRLVSQPSSAVPSSTNLYVWVLLTYDRIYKLNRPASSYFKEPFATAVQTNKQFANISTSLHLTVTDAFKNGVLNGTDTPLVNAIKDNDVHDWKPTKPLKLFYGDADDLVPGFNTTTTLAAMKARGANVESKLTPGGTHGSTINDYLLGTFEFFSLNK